MGRVAGVAADRVIRRDRRNLAGAGAQSLETPWGQAGPSWRHHVSLFLVTEMHSPTAHVALYTSNGRAASTGAGRTDRLAEGALSTVQHRNASLPHRSEPPRTRGRRRNTCCRDSSSFRDTVLPSVRCSWSRQACRNGWPEWSGIAGAGAGALLLLLGKITVPAAVRCAGTLALHGRIRFEGCRTAGPGDWLRGRRFWERCIAGWIVGAASCETSG